jgi:hypothetical protein
MFGIRALVGDDTGRLGRGVFERKVERFIGQGWRCAAAPGGRSRQCLELSVFAIEEIVRDFRTAHHHDQIIKAPLQFLPRTQ